MVVVKRALWVLSMVAVSHLVAPAPAAAQLAKAGVVTTLQGTASVARAGLPQPAPLKFKDEIFVQDRITTGDNSIARILLGGKAIVTVRERSSLIITEVPGTSTIQLGVGKVAVAAVKERMKPGESIEIRTPNAVAGIRGTVVITEVEQTTAQVGATGGVFTTTVTVLRGLVQFTPLQGGAVAGPSLSLGALDQARRSGVASPVARRVTREAAEGLAGGFRINVTEPPPAAAAAGASLSGAHVQQAAKEATALLPGAPAQGSGDARAGSREQQARDDRGGDTAAGQPPTSPSGSSGPSSSGPGPSGPGPSSGSSGASGSSGTGGATSGGGGSGGSAPSRSGSSGPSVSSGGGTSSGRSSSGPSVSSGPSTSTGSSSSGRSSTPRVVAPSVPRISGTPSTTSTRSTVQQAIQQREIQERGKKRAQ